MGGYIVNHRKRHPYADRPLICYDVAMIMEPMTLLGLFIYFILFCFVLFCFIFIFIILFLLFYFIIL